MGVRQAVNSKWGAIVALVILLACAGVYLGRAGWSRKPISATKPEAVDMAVHCPSCGASKVIKLSEYGALPKNDQGMPKCPACGQFTLTVDRHYRPPAPPPQPGP